MKKITGKLFSIILAIALVISMAVPAFAEEPGQTGDEAGLTADITVSVNNKGVFGTAKDGAAMVARSVTVTDLDADGHLTVDEALVAAHEAYFTGGTNGYSQTGGTVKKLWGVETTNTLFFVNGAGLSTGVTVDEVTDGCALYASVNADTTYYADWYTQFDKFQLDLTEGESATLNLKGHLGMAYTDVDKADTALSGIQLGIWKDGAVTALEGAVTDADGNATVSFSQPGTYVLTASGATEGVVTDWNLMNYKTMDDTVDGTAFVSYDWTTYDTFVAYTDADYGDGPYPAAEVKTIPMFDEDDEETEWESLHYLKSNKLIADCPIMAPYCVAVVVERDADYSAVDAAMEKVPSDLTIYTDASAKAVKDTVAAVVKGKKASEQATVNTMASDINKAVAGLKYNLKKATVKLSKTSYAYNGKVKKPGVTVTIGGKKLTKDKDYTVAYSNNKNVGQKATVTITGKGSCAEKISKTFTITQGTKKITAAAKKKTLTAKAAKKKATIKKANAFKVSGLAGRKVTFKKTSGNKKITVSSSGNITVKKGLKKGETYTVKVKVTAKASKNYKAASKTVTLKIKIK